MQNYRVEWAIDIEADSPEEAVHRAKMYAERQRLSTFEVTDEDGNTETIDTESCQCINWDCAGSDPMTGHKYKRCTDCGQISIR